MIRSIGETAEFVIPAGIGDLAAAGVNPAEIQLHDHSGNRHVSGAIRAVGIDVPIDEVPDQTCWIDRDIHRAVVVSGGKTRLEKGNVSIAASIRADRIVGQRRIPLAVSIGIRRIESTEGDGNRLAGTGVDRTEVMPSEGSQRCGDVRRNRGGYILQFCGIISVDDRPLANSVRTAAARKWNVVGGDTETDAVHIIVTCVTATCFVSDERGG